MTHPAVPHCIRELLRPYQAAFDTGLLRLEPGSRHARLRNTKSGDWISLPSTPGGVGRCVANVRSEVARLHNTGRGTLARHGAPIAGSPGGLGKSRIGQ